MVKLQTRFGGFFLCGGEAVVAFVNGGVSQNCSVAAAALRVRCWLRTCLGESHPVFMTTGKLVDMSRYPLDLFPKLATMIFMALPLARTVWWPCQALLRDTSLPLTCIGMARIAALCVSLLNWMWRAGMRHYAGAGG